MSRGRNRMPALGRVGFGLSASCPVRGWRTLIKLDLRVHGLANSPAVAKASPRAVPANDGLFPQ